MSKIINLRKEREEDSREADLPNNVVDLRRDQSDSSSRVEQPDALLSGGGVDSLANHSKAVSAVESVEEQEAEQTVVSQPDSYVAGDVVDAEVTGGVLEEAAGYASFEDATDENEEVIVDASMLEEERTPQQENGEEKSQSNRFYAFRQWRSVVWAGYKPAILFVVACLVLTSVFGTLSFVTRGKSLQASVTELGKKALSQMTSGASAASAANLPQAQADFLDASATFQQAQQQTDELGATLLAVTSSVPGFSKVRSGSSMLRAGEHISQAGAALVSFGQAFLQVEPASVINVGQSLSFTDMLVAGQGSLSVAASELQQADTELRRVDAADFPPEYRDQIVLLQEQLPALSQSLFALEESSDLLLEVLGHYSPKTYVFLFQNTAERRGTGGFIGSFGLIKMEKGKVTSLDVENIYDLDGQFHEQFPGTVIPPQPLQLITEEWGLRDANYYADGPASFEKVSWFIEKAGGPTVDGIFTMTPTVLQRLLEVSGPVTVNDGRLTLDSETIMPFIRQSVETEKVRDANNDPKHVLSELTPALLQSFFHLAPQEMMSAWSVLSRSLSERHVLLYFHNEELQKRVQQQGWSGRVEPFQGDYLQVVSQNIGGKKTDAVIEQWIEHDVHISGDGKIQDTVTITKQHNAVATDPDWLNTTHQSFMEVFVPRGSTLLSVDGASGAERPSLLDVEDENLLIDPLVNRVESATTLHEPSGTRTYQAFGKTVFGNWLDVDPGEVKSLSFTYELPDTQALDLSSVLERTDSYSLLQQKQSGDTGTNMRLTLTIDGPWDIVWRHPQEMQLTQQGATRIITGDRAFENDGLTSIVFEH